jgi:hypothetical protein
MMTLGIMERTMNTTATDQTSFKERRASRRTKLARKALIRTSQPPYNEEVQPTSNFSRSSVYFVTPSKQYHVGMRVSVIPGYVPNDPCNSTSFGEVVRIDKLADGKLGIAVRILLT